MAGRKYTVTINSAFQGGGVRTIEGTLPLGGQLAYELGARYPTAQQLANYYAGEFCDSGTVAVQMGADRGLVGRREIPQ